MLEEFHKLQKRLQAPPQAAFSTSFSFMSRDAAVDFMSPMQDVTPLSGSALSMTLPLEKPDELQKGLMGAFTSRSAMSNSLNDVSTSAQSGLPALDPFNTQLELPPLPTLTSSLLVDPDNKRMGEQLVTKTFFS